MNIKNSVLTTPKRKECIAFLRQFIMYLENGYTLYESWQICRDLFEGKKKFAFISEICQLIEEGHSWKSSMQSVLSVQSELYNLSWAKNQEGLLKCAQHILENINRSHSFFHQLFASLVYPGIIFSGLIITIIVYHGIIRPQFFAFLPIETNWNNILLPIIVAGVLLFSLFFIMYLYMNPLKQYSNKGIFRHFTIFFKISNLRTWEVLLMHLDIHISSGFTLWDAISSMRFSYGKGNAISQLAIIQRSLFESRNLKQAVLKNKNIPECIRSILYSSLVCNKVSDNISLLQTIIDSEIKQIISLVTTSVAPLSIAVSGWAVLGICLDLLVPIHQYLGGSIL